MPQKCYIAGKIGDLPISEYQPKFESGEITVIAMGYEPISPIKQPHNHDKKWEDYMAEDITALIKCTAIYILKDWESSKGARLEVKIARRLGLKLIYQDL